MPKNAYYLFLKSIETGKRLKKSDEVVLGDSPTWCLAYARITLKGRLPDYLHNKMVLGVWESEEDSEAAKKYLTEFAGNSQSV